MKASVGFFIFLICNFSQPLSANESGSPAPEEASKALATLVVTYRVEGAVHSSEGERIKFWLINEKDERSLYPKSDELVCSAHAPSEKVVVIPSLPAGVYWVEFALPNCFGYFEQVPLRRLELKAGEVAHVDQLLRPLKVQAS